MSDHVHERLLLQRLAAGPVSGDLACGETGLGKMSEPAEIFEHAMKLLASDLPLAGKADDVVHRQEIGFVAQFGDQRELMVDTQLHRFRHALRIAAQQTAFGFMA